MLKKLNVTRKKHGVRRNVQQFRWRLWLGYVLPLIRKRMDGGRNLSKANNRKIQFFQNAAVLSAFFPSYDM